MSVPLIELRDVAFSYPGQPVFSEVNLRLATGERLALVGDNGSGKSTLLQLLLGLQQPSQGELLLFGEGCSSEIDFQPVRHRVGLLFQDSDDQLFCPSVLEDVAFGPLNLGKTAAEARAIAESTLERLGLLELSGRITHKLSGGQKRLVALATVLAMEPEVLLLDEPTNGLDQQAETRLIELLQGLPQAMILVTHDRRLIERLANRAAIMQQGTLVEAVMHSHPHQHTHSHLHIHPADHHDSHQQQVPQHSDHHVDSV